MSQPPPAARSGAAAKSPVVPPEAGHPPPRAVTPRARRRSWGEPGVRAWWVLAAAMFVAALGVAAAQWIGWRHDTRLIRNGTLVEATLIGADRRSLPGQKVRAGQEGYFKFTFQGQEHVVQGRLPARANDVYIDGERLPARIDPSNPDDWTPRLTVPPLAQEMIGPMFLGPLAVILLLVALLARWRTLRTWTRGVAREAVVLGTRNTAVAPASRVLRCTIAAGADKRVFEVVVPTRDGTFDVNDKLWVVTPAGKVSPALPLVSYA